jgi:hypothetical protein
MPVDVDVVEVEFKVTRLAETVVLEAGVVDPTWLTFTVTDVLATVVVETLPLPAEEPLAARPVMLK